MDGIRRRGQEIRGGEMTWKIGEPDLFDPWVPYRLARSVDVDTSKEAARAIAPKLSRQHLAILELMRERPGVGMSGNMVTAGLGFGWRRMNELRDLGLIMRVVKAPDPSGQNAWRYLLTEEIARQRGVK